MDWGAALGNLGSSLVSGLFGQSSAREQMDFQRQMSNTQYTRAARDLERAGLNRILALGSPASAPPGASASMPDARLGDAFVSGASAKQAIKTQQAQENVFEEQALKTIAETEEAYSRTRVNNATAKEIAARIPTHDSLITLQGKQGGLADAQSKQDAGERALQDWMAEGINALRDKISEGGDLSISDIIGLFLRGARATNSAKTVVAPKPPSYRKSTGAPQVNKYKPTSSPSRGRQRGVTK